MKKTDGIVAGAYTTHNDPRLFNDLQGGRIVCRRHLGGYGTTMLNAHPYGETTVTTAAGRVAGWITPLDVWVVMTDAERKQFNIDLADIQCIAECEDCKYTPDNPEMLAERLLGVAP
jgi:hypothetical protein